jgi:deoxyribodipyrimidine photolyase-related protein
MTTLCLLFSNQLFPVEAFKGSSLSDDIHFAFIEHPIFFGTDSERRINFNKLKLTLHRASGLFYVDYLKEQKYIVHYVPHSKYTISSMKRLLRPYKKVYYIDNPDYLLDRRMVELDRNIERIDSIHPTFLMSPRDISDYESFRGKKKYFHASFYSWQRNRLNILMDSDGTPEGGQYSYDTFNREPLGSHDISRIPEIPNVNRDSAFKTDMTYIKKAQRQIDDEFPNNYGNTKLYIPVTYSGAEAWLEDFIEHRLEHFGAYEDAVLMPTKANQHVSPFLYHGVLSPLLNVGLLRPRQVVDKALSYYKKNADKKGRELLYSVEGFVRQIIGWREWQRLLYKLEYKSLKTSNYWDNKRSLGAQWWPTRSRGLGVKPIDDTIDMAYEFGYLHHILRLMYMSNFMNLCRIHPDEMYKWFMSFAMDSYDWVMTQNVYGMGSGADGGFTMTKPYITTGNYIQQMSNYSLSKEEGELWKALYYTFLDDNQDRLNKYKRVSWMLLKHLSSKSRTELGEYHKIAGDFLRKFTIPYEK